MIMRIKQKGREDEVSRCREIAVRSPSLARLQKNQEEKARWDDISEVGPQRAWLVSDPLQQGPAQVTASCRR
jgi:hypothetical protein